MDNAYKYRIWCNTESKWEYVISEDAETAPTLCPANTSHTIDINKTSILEKLQKDQLKMEYDIVGGGPANLFEGCQFTATNSTTTTYDFKFTQDFFLNKGELECDGNQHFKDKIDGQIIDVDGVTYPAGTVLRNYIKTYPLCKSGNTPFETDKKTVINLKNFYLRIKYTSVGTTNVDVNVRMRGFDS